MARYGNRMWSDDDLGRICAHLYIEKGMHKEAINMLKTKSVSGQTFCTVKRLVQAIDWGYTLNKLDFPEDTRNNRFLSLLMQLKESGKSVQSGVLGGLYSFVDYYFDFKGFAARYSGLNNVLLRATQPLFLKFLSTSKS